MIKKKKRKQKVLAAGFVLFCFVFLVSHLHSLLIFYVKQNGKHSTWCGRATRILWPSSRWRRGSTSSRAARGLGGDGAQVTAREAGGDTQGALLFTTDIYILQNYHSEGKWNLLNIVWDTKERQKSSKDVQNNKLFCGSQILSLFLSYWATTSWRLKRFTVSQDKALSPLCLWERLNSVMLNSG